MLECPKCNFNNELGRIFCHQCGNKLDLSQIKAPTEGQKLRRRAKRSVSRVIRVTLELIIAVVLIAVIVLICLVPEVKPFKPSNAESLAADTKRMDLEQIVNSRKGGRALVTETDINSFLSSLTFSKPAGNGLEVTPEALRATLGDGAVKLEFTGLVHFGTIYNKRIYFGYEGLPEIRGEQLVFQPTGGWIGKLPIAPVILSSVPFFDNIFGSLFRNLTDEKKVLDRLTAITITKQGAHLTKDAAK